ncbi:MAG: YcxB family protein [Flavobacterium sp.]|nr:MAG: YcxB family protein [Flavobacterium sp.]
MQKDINIINQPELDDLTKASMYLLLTLPLVYIIPSSAILLSVTNGYGLASGNVKHGAADIWTPLLALPMMAVFYVLLRNATRKSLSKNRKSLERQVFTFNAEGFSVKGESYHTEFFWRDIRKIKETKSWFLIYTHKLAAQPIRKQTLSDADYTGLKKLFASLPVKQKLKP